MFEIKCKECNAVGPFEYLKLKDGSYSRTNGIAEISFSESECETCGSHRNLEVRCTKCGAIEVLEND